MKRIISVVLSLVMLISMFSLTVTADTSTSQYNDAENFAFALGITDKSSYNPYAYLTRAEFCSLVYNLLKAGENKEVENTWQEENFGDDAKNELVVPGDTLLFDDVDTTVPQYQAIKYMVDNGLVNGITEKSFGPSYNITTAAVTKIMINILGYDFMAQENGGFPNGYIYTANRLKLLSGINASANDFITLRDCLNIFYNALDVKLFELDYIDADGEVYFSKGEDSFLTAGLGFVRIEGIVSDTGITTVYGDSKVGEKRAVIDGVTVDAQDCTDVRSYIGREVSAYCYYDENGKYILKYIQPMDDNSLTIDTEDFISFASGKITYADEKGNIKTANTASQNKLMVVYNGKALGKYDADTFSFPFGDITLIATEGKTYDLAVIRDYDVGMVSKVRAADMYVYSETLYKDMDAVKYLNLDPDDLIVDVRNANGEKLDASQVAKGDVISAMVSRDGKYVEAIVSKTVVSGFVIDTVSENSSDILYTNGSDEYTLSHKTKLAKTPAVKIGKAHNMYLDHKGRLVYIDTASEDTTGEKAGFITGVENSQTGFNKECKIRLYTEDGLMVIYDFDERIILNGDTRKTEDVIGDIKAAGDAQKAILYTADTKTKVIKSIVLPLEFGAEDTDNRGWYHISPDKAKLSRDENDTDESWKVNYDTYKLRWHINGYSFGRLMYWDKATTKTISIPDNVSRYDDERDFMVSSGTQSFGNGYGQGDAEKHLIHGYSRDQKAMAAELIVYAPQVKGVGEVNEKGCFVVEKLVNALDRDGEIVTQLTGYEIVLSPSSCKKASYIIDEDTYFTRLNHTTSLMERIDPENYDITQVGPGKISDLAPGDIIRVSKGSDGVLESILVTYDESQDLHFCKAPTYASTNANMDIAAGYPVYVSGKYVRLLNTDYLPENVDMVYEDLIDPAKLQALHTGTGSILVVDRTAKGTVIRQGSMDDIVAYEDTGACGSYQRVVGVLYQGHAMITVIYNVTE